MRLFVGCFVRIVGYEQLKEAVGECFEGRWVPEANLHLTFAFLGEADASEIIRDLDGLNLPQHTVRFDRLGLFGSRLLYATSDDPGLYAAAEEIGERLGSRFQREERFVPHVTLLRMRRGRPSIPVKLPESLPEGVKIDAELKAVLIESLTGPEGGTVYRRVKEGE